MRSYGQYCGVARALDVVGDRWSLLVVRELLVRPCRFTDLREGLSGVARNLLADRLRSLQDAGLVTREDGLYALTPRGAALKPVLQELVRWAIPLMVTGQGGDDARGHWLGLAAETIFRDADLSGLAGLEVELVAEGDEVVLRVDREHGLVSAPGPAAAPDVVLRGSAEGVLAALTGHPIAAPAEILGDARRLADLSGRLPAIL